MAGEALGTADEVLGSPAGAARRETVLEWALEYLRRGFSVVPLRYGEKVPIVRWEEYQRRKPTEEEVREWFSQSVNVGIICGSVSGNLLVIDFDSQDVFKAVLQRLPQHLLDKFRNTWVVATGKGVHVYFRAESPPRSSRIGKVELKGEGTLVVAPPSLHPSGARYRFLNPRASTVEELRGQLGPEAIADADLRVIEQIAREAQGLAQRPRPGAEGGEGTRGLRQLGDSDLLRVKELLKEAYRPGYRHHLLLYLSGWAAKARVHPIPIVRIVKMLHEETGDEDPLKARLAAVVYSYKKAGIDIDAFADEIEKIAGVKPYGLEREIAEEGVKGKSGLQEVLEQAIGEERALEIMGALSEILGASPYAGDALIAVLDYEKQLYAVADARKGSVVLAARTATGLKYKRKVFLCAPIRIAYYPSPLGGIAKYEVVFREESGRERRVGPAEVDDILGWLKANGLVVSKRDAEDVLAAVLYAAVVKGRAEVREEIDKPGFFPSGDGKIKAIGIDSGVNAEKLREALLFLDELVEKWFSRVKSKAATVVKWGAVAPLAFVLKARRSPLPFLFLLGASSTGKTTLGAVVLSMWGAHQNMKGGENVTSPARLAHVLETGTLPVVINEPRGVFNREDIVEMLKVAYDNTIVRGRFERGIYREYLALAPLMFTSNNALPLDDALLRRMYVLRFTVTEAVEKEDEVERFNKEVLPRLPLLHEVGKFIARRAQEDGLPDGAWHEIAEQLLREAYEAAGLQPPEWLRLLEKGETIREIRDEMIARAIGLIRETLEETYSRVFRAAPPSNVNELLTAFENSLIIQWLIVKKDKVVITREIEALLEQNGIGLGGLKGLAEAFGWRYGEASVKVGGRVLHRYVAEVPREEFASLLASAALE